MLECGHKEARIEWDGLLPFYSDSLELFLPTSLLAMEAKVPMESTFPREKETTIDHHQTSSILFQYRSHVAFDMLAGSCWPCLGDKDTVISSVQLRMSKSQQSPLRDREVQQLLKLEQLFHSHYLTEELLNDMIGLYVRFGENVGQGQHSLKLYFMQKIKFVLSRPQVVKGLEREGSEAIKQHHEVEMRRMAQVAKQNQANSQRQKAPISTQIEQKERMAKIELQMKVMKEVQEGMNAFREGMGRQSQRRQQKENEINQLVTQQDKALAERRANRKKKLRKKSADLTEKETIVEAAAPPIQLAQLKMVQKELNQTYERFTRLTQNKLKLESNKKPNKGRVRFQIEEKSYQEEEFFDQLNHEVKKEAPSKNIMKKKSSLLLLQDQPQSKPLPQAIPPPRDTTTVQYKTFDQNKGRVTVRNNQYQQIDEEQF